MSDRIELATGLLAEYRNDWGGGDDAEAIAAAHYAVCVERDDDGWVVAAETLQDIAGVILSTLVDTEGYDENVTRIVDMTTGEDVHVTFTTSVAAELDGVTAVASERPAPEACPHCGYPLDAEVWNCVNIEAHRAAVNAAAAAREAGS